MINTRRLGAGLTPRSLSTILVMSVVMSGLVSGLMSGCTTKISDSVITRISTTEASKRQGAGKALFIDTRPGPDFTRGHIPGAINLRLGDISYTDRDPRLTDRSPLIVYGENPGSATAMAMAKRLLELEYEGVAFYEPGFAGWRSAGLPVDRSGD